MFIIGGFNCYPAEIESILLGCPGVAQVAVIGIPDERLGEVAHGLRRARARRDARRPRRSSRGAATNMANYKVPRRVAIVDALPMNATGKVTKFVLREQHRRSTERAASSPMLRRPSSPRNFSRVSWVESAFLGRVASAPRAKETRP